MLNQTEGLLRSGSTIVTNILVPLIFLLALLYFFYGVGKYIWSEGQGKDDGKKIMIWGVVALFVMSSIWGLVYYIRTELKIAGESSVQIPNVGSGAGVSDYRALIPPGDQVSP